ncbi:MAG TPA: hypothetical protein VM118_01960, partial [Acidobacteriota bacterium]|nr:hypothetical protein [Acidobacteriota bacterium]
MRISLRNRIELIVVVCASLLAVHCGGGGNGSSGPSLTSAWEKFEAGQYDAAIAEFADVVGDVSDAAHLAEGYCGLGWSYAFDDQLDAAATSFASALNTGAESVDAAAGASAVALARGEHTDATSLAQAALAIDPDWSFNHYPGIDWKDLRLILAQAYFGLGAASYDDAQAEVDILDPDNGLDP